MDRWRSVLKVPIHAESRACCRVAASLCFSPASRTLVVPSANVIFFNGDRVEGTGNSVIEKLSDPLNIADVLVSKFGGSVNAWVIEASTFNGPFAVYKEFIPSVNRYGEPRSYGPIGFPASSSILSLLSNFLKEAKNVISSRNESISTSSFSSQGHQPESVILGFSKGGTVLNQLLAELSHAEIVSVGRRSCTGQELFDRLVPKLRGGIPILPATKDSLLNSIREIHYVDVGLNSSGAYITDHNVIGKISERIAQGAHAIRFVLHGTPRQWYDRNRPWICLEKDGLLRLLEAESRKVGGKIEVAEKFYFAERPPDLQMHFEIIEKLNVGVGL